MWQVLGEPAPTFSKLEGYYSFAPSRTLSSPNQWRRIMQPNIALPETGFVRLKSILAPDGPIPVSKSTWWQGVKDGRFPKPQKLGARVTVWRVEDIRALIENGAG
jgi:prophage regulatory protein